MAHVGHSKAVVRSLRSRISPNCPRDQSTRKCIGYSSRGAPAIRSPARRLGRSSHHLGRPVHAPPIPPTEQWPIPSAHAIEHWPTTLPAIPTAPRRTHQSEDARRSRPAPLEAPLCYSEDGRGDTSQAIAQPAKGPAEKSKERSIHKGQLPHPTFAGGQPRPEGSKAKVPFASIAFEKAACSESPAKVCSVS